MVNEDARLLCELLGDCEALYDGIITTMQFHEEASKIASRAGYPGRVLDPRHSRAIPPSRGGA